MAWACNRTRSPAVAQIGQAIVHRYLEKAAAAKVTWPLPEDFDDRRLDELLFPKRPLHTPSQPRPGLDFAQLHTQLQTHKHLTLQLLWEEYRETQPDGYGYSRFCELYQRWNRNRDVVLRHDHNPGDKTFVDWAGDTVPIYDRESGEVTPASIFVAVIIVIDPCIANPSLRCGVHGLVQN